MRKITYLILFGCLCLFQSCFEVVEQLVFKDDGSGSFQLLVNMSKSKTKLNSIRKMKTVNGHDVPTKEEISSKVKELENAIKNTAGITNVKTALDFDNYIASISCNFSKVNNLNLAARNVAKLDNGNDKVLEDAYQYDPGKKIFSRMNKFFVKEDYRKMSNADKEIFATANYTGIFRFDSEVAGTSNKESKVSANKKAVMLKLNALDVLSQKRSIENNINLVK
ncbi:hypothetical protein BH11BAC4_BH11BAC4_17620 [soil metagenome]